MDPIDIGTKIALQQFKEKDKADPVEKEPGEVLQSFGQVLKDSIKDVNNLQEEAEKATQTYAVGGPVELHQVMIATERAELALELATQIRNKMLQAYQEISRMGG